MIFQKRRSFWSSLSSTGLEKLSFYLYYIFIYIILISVYLSINFKLDLTKENFMFQASCFWNEPAPKLTHVYLIL